MAEYNPDANRRGNPITCVTTWIGSLFRGRTPVYETPPTAPTVAPTGTAVARVRGIDVQRAHAYTIAGDPCSDAGPIVTLTLVVDDDATAATIVEALHSGAAIRVATLAAAD